MAQLVRVQASNAWGHAYFKDLLTNSEILSRGYEGLSFSCGW